LKHHDDRGDHILVDNHFNITAIIDWEYASIEVRDFAFSSHCIMWPAADFYNGKNNLSREEIEFASIFRKRGRSDMADILLKGRRWQRFLVSVSENMSSGPQEFQNLFQGLRAALLDECEPEKLVPYDEWRAKAIPQYANTDEKLQRLVREDLASAPGPH
jgi:hypothetical protein